MKPKMLGSEPKECPVCHRKSLVINTTDRLDLPVEACLRCGYAKGTVWRDA